jgi:hypothetical protein
VKIETIYIELLDEGVEVWRPVRAERRQDGLFRILSRPSDETEAWKFPQGSVVRCEEKTFSGGNRGLVARERVS